MNTERYCYFHSGVLVLEGVQAREPIPPPWRWSHGKWRTEGYRYAQVRSWLSDQEIDDHVRRWRTLNYTLSDARAPHDYQLQALESWEQADRRGCVVLPTGAGKSLIAVHAIQAVNRSAVVVAPSQNLLHQWYSILRNFFSTEVGVYYGAEKILRPLMVTTYHSLGSLVSEYGVKSESGVQKLLVLDECHHLTAPTFGEGALMSPAPFRLGLTATYPTEEEQSEGRWRLDDLIGPVVFSLAIDDLTGERLATYRTQRYRVSLTPDEMDLYTQYHDLYLGFVAQRGLQDKYEAEWLRELMRLSTKDREARRALLARRYMNRLLAGCQGKLQAVEALLREHQHEQVLIFTELNDIAYRIARRFVIPCLTASLREQRSARRYWTASRNTASEL
jgi:superfamily II DNA or RNA helicase